MKHRNFLLTFYFLWKHRKHTNIQQIHLKWIKNKRHLMGVKHNGDHRCRSPTLWTCVHSDLRLARRCRARAPISDANSISDADRRDCEQNFYVTQIKFWFFIANSTMKMRNFGFGLNDKIIQLSATFCLLFIIVEWIEFECRWREMDKLEFFSLLHAFNMYCWQAGTQKALILVTLCTELLIYLDLHSNRLKIASICNFWYIFDI